ncbi:MAG: hypothetical protein AAB583_02455, partial [Patescibacteria group bacterium]
MNKKSIVLFDIDYTLFDAEKFKKKIFLETVKAVGHKKTNDVEDKIRDLYAASRRINGFFNQRLFVRDLVSEFNLITSPSQLGKLIFKESTFRGNMYKETKQVLNLLSRNKLLRIGIFSTGYDRFQRKKIKEIEDFLHKEHIYIFVFKDRELSNIIKRYKTHSLYLIDDHLGILYMAKRVKKKVFTIWVKRGRFAENQKNIPGFEPDAEVEN